MKALAQALGWITEIKRIEVGRSARGLSRPNRQDTNSLDSNLPDAVIFAESTMLATALKLKERSNGRLKLICLTRPRGSFAKLDLIITTPQFGLPAASNTLEISLPLTSPVSKDHEQTAQSNCLLLVVGGASSPFIMNKRAVRQLCTAVREKLVKSPMPLLATTSFRTGWAVELLLKSELKMAEQLYCWSKGDPNPYRKFLERASEVVVTSDSVSMVADAIAAAKPVSIYRLPQTWNPIDAVVSFLWRISSVSRKGTISKLIWSMFDRGMLQPRADRIALYEGLIQSGLATWFGGVPPRPDPELLVRDMQLAVARVLQLFNPPK